MGSDGKGGGSNNNDGSPGKLFVGGLSWQTTPDKLREYFGQFGTVTDVLVMKDPVTQVGNQPRRKQHKILEMYRPRKYLFKIATSLTQKSSRFPVLSFNHKTYIGFYKEKCYCIYKCDSALCLK